ncbi:hypothetical protein [Paenibacillus sp. GXUN7292]|uniref:hypothetical protein n=1 Tax=Paenibacillus sp. GXUN7292 TaxID=3422499 RepID=UPI003D7E2EE9
MPVAGKIYEMFSDADLIYNYCPAPVCTDEETMYVFYCANTQPGLVIDDIYARKGKLRDGLWEFGEKFRVLEPSRLGWDCIHVCDPDVIKGEFHYKGETYNWMMVFLGCDIHYSYHNQIGIAFAKQIEGPYIKYDANPIVAYEEMFHWGAGQPCILSLDGKGKFRMLYTKSIHEYERRMHITKTFWRDLDFSNADNPIIGEEVLMHEGGVWNATLNDQADEQISSDINQQTSEGYNPDPNVSIFNPSILWDRQTDCYYLTREGTPFDKDRVPGFISSYVQLLVIPREKFERNEGGWQVLYNYSEKDTGFPRNHNAGLIKNDYGWRMPGTALSTAVTVSKLHPTHFLWTYRIYHTELSSVRKEGDS